MRKKGFTLIEMIIVIVIIGILAAAILSKILGARDRANDVKRVADLRNVATALEMYYMDNGEYPFWNGGKIPAGGNAYNFFRKFSDLESVLGSYISEIPKDPQKNSQIDVCLEGGGHRNMCKDLLGKGEYLYKFALLSNKNSYDFHGTPIVLLYAKVATPSNANTIIFDYQNIRCRGCAPGGWGMGNSSTSGIVPANIHTRQLETCTTLTKGNTPSITKNNGSVDCIYSSSEQLYYMMRVDF